MFSLVAKQSIADGGFQNERFYSIELWFNTLAEGELAVVWFVMTLFRCIPKCNGNQKHIYTDEAIIIFTMM